MTDSQKTHLDQPFIEKRWYNYKDDFHEKPFHKE